MKKSYFSHFGKRFGFTKVALLGATLLFSGYVFMSYAANSAFIEERVNYIMRVFEANEVKYELTGDNRIEYYKTLRSIYAGVVNAINIKLGDSIEDAIDDSLSGTLDDGTGSTLAPIVTARVSGIASTTNPGQFTNKAQQGTNIQLQYQSSNVRSTISYQIFRGTGPLDNSNLATGTNYVQYANLVGNTSSTYNIELQAMPIGTYSIVVTGCNNSNQCVSTPAVLFEVISSSTSTGSVYNRQAKKVCEGKSVSNGIATQRFMWYDSDNKPTDLIATCTQPALVNGGLICSEKMATGCCPAGQVAINGNCTAPANVGENCFATSGCKTGLTCNSGTNKCTQATTTAACNAGNSFNFATNGKNCVGVMPSGVLNDTKTANATEGQGTATVKCTPTGWTVVTPNCLVDKDGNTGTGGSSLTGSTIVGNEDLQVQLIGVPYTTNAAGTYARVVRGQKVSGTYALSNRVTSVSNLGCKLWYSTNADKSLGSEYSFITNGGVTNTSQNRTDEFIIPFNHPVGVNQVDINARCFGSMNGAYANIMYKETINIVEPNVTINLSSNKTLAKLGEEVTVSWSLPSDTGHTVCTAHRSIASGGFATIGSSNQIYNPSMSLVDKSGVLKIIPNSADTKPIDVVIWCNGGPNGTTKMTTITIDGGGTSSPTYSWSWNQSSWSACTGPCGTNQGSQNKDAVCLRNDGVTVSVTLCTTPKPTRQSQSCTSSICQSLSCLGGTTTKTSPDSSNTCYYSWTTTPAGQSAIASVPSGGGTLNGTCGTDGNWLSWILTCPNIASTVVTCAGGGKTFYSLDQSNQCRVSFDQKNAGQTISIGNGAYDDYQSGVTGSALCRSDGNWSFQINCPSKTGSKTCPMGSDTLPSSSGKAACTFDYPSVNAGQWATADAFRNGVKVGWVKAYCGTNGEWDQSSPTFSCP